MLHWLFKGRKQLQPLSRTIDLNDPGVSIDPFPWYERLRAEGETVFLPKHGCWLVLSHAAVKLVLSRPDLFSSAPYSEVDAALLAADPPRHGEVRKLVSRHFGGEALARLAAKASESARGLVRPEMDAVGDFGRPLSRAVAAELIGFDSETVATIVEAEQAAGGDLQRLASVLDEAAGRSTLYRRFEEEGGGIVNETERRSLVRLMWLASTATTERTIAQAVLRLTRSEELQRRLGEEPGLLPAFVEEVVRLHPAENAIRRTAVEATTIGGVKVPAGAFLQLCLPAANRDPEWIEAPDALRLDRGATDHVSFGCGIHRCVGAPLTRRIVAAALAELLRGGRTLHALRPLEDTPYAHSMLSCAPSSLATGISEAAMPDAATIAALACPVTGEPLELDEDGGRLLARTSGRSYAIRSGIPILIAAEADGGRPEAAFAERYDSVIAAPSMREIYGDSGYFNVGYWVDGVGTLAEACDRMVDELARPVPSGARLILDAGCGVGAGTKRLAAAFPEALTIGINISHGQLVQALRRGVKAAMVSDAARLGIADGAADAVIACESPQHFDTRAEFLAEAYRVLRPGGRISIADMLFRERGPVGEWMLPERNFVDGPEAYRALLEQAGFTDVTVEDVTERSWTRFCRIMAKSHRGPPEDVAAVEASLSHYVIASATKPERP